jgi:phosphoribosylformylglycinamidine (FGAM) synthase-like enzyme
METTVETAKQLRLLPEEFELIRQILGRTPNFNELAAYSVMWSEHCSYKKQVRKMPDWLISVVDTALFSKLNRTTILRPLNPFRVLPPVLAVFTEIFLRWGQGRSQP